MMKIRYNKNGWSFYKDKLMVDVIRHGNDVYGNPLYKVFPVNFMFRHSCKAYRNYEKYSGDVSYYLLQSYNINDDVFKLLQNISRVYNNDFKNFKEYELDNNWISVTTLSELNK